MDWAVRLYDVTASFPDDERFGLVSQMRRAAVSVPSDTAEGYDRGSNKEFIQFLQIALGSNAELRTQLYLAQRLTKLDSAIAQELMEQTRVVSAQLAALIRTRESQF